MIADWNANTFNGKPVVKWPPCRVIDLVNQCEDPREFLWIDTGRGEAELVLKGGAGQPLINDRNRGLYTKVIKGKWAIEWIGGKPPETTEPVQVDPSRDVKIILAGR